MNSKRLYFGLVGFICLLVVLMVAGAYGTNKLLGTRAAHLTSLKATAEALDNKQTSLASIKKEVSQYSSLQTIAKAIVPEDKNQAEAVLQIVNIAHDNGVTLASITFPNSTLGASLPGAAPTTAAAAANSKQSALSQLTPVKNIPGVYNLPITVTGDDKQPITYNQFINFLSDLEHNRRTAQVSTLTLTPSQDNPSLLSFTLTLNEYIKP